MINSVIKIYIRIISFFKLRRDTYLHYFKNHINSPLALYALKKCITPNVDSPAVFLERLSSLPKEARLFPEAITFKKSLEGFQNSQPGMYVDDFEQLDT